MTKQSATLDGARTYKRCQERRAPEDRVIERVPDNVAHTRLYRPLGHVRGVRLLQGWDRLRVYDPLLHVRIRHEARAGRLLPRRASRIQALSRLLQPTAAGHTRPLPGAEP